ncbi:hypothetical protein A3Q56_03337 [Intoshia linei]|uniref:Uncharacterized protein n=1 Tax=Intoshia linei TaxID=1819745 RepID=A0A177B5P1_9BILA|nr:hypothetical protein A3Q56_03337 [Intoshia linei]
MTTILCNWIDDVIEIKETLNDKNLGNLFNNGYLFGQILNKHDLQDDFGLFVDKCTNNAKLNNFIRLEPVMTLLQIEFNANTAKQIMESYKPTIASILYQLYIALTNKEKAKLTNMNMESIIPRAKLHLAKHNSRIFRNRLYKTVERQTNVNIKAVKEMFKNRENKTNRQFKMQIEKAFEMEKRIKKKKVHIQENVNENENKRLNHIEHVLREEIISRPIRKIAPFSINLHTDQHKKKKIESVSFNDKYFMSIKSKKLILENERIEREKRRRCVLYQQMEAHAALNAEKQEDALFSNLIKQSIMEKRIAVELINLRKIKDVIKENRRNEQIRMKSKNEYEFRQAFNKKCIESELKSIEITHQSNYKKNIAKEEKNKRLKKKYDKHFEICKKIMDEMVELSLKCTKYRILCDNKLIPIQLYNDWKCMFINGIDLSNTEENDEEITSKTKILYNNEAVNTMEEIDLINENSFQDYQNFNGMWVIPYDNLPQINIIRTKLIFNNLSSVLNQIVNPSLPENDAILLNYFPLRALFIGKPFCGKSEILEMLESFNLIKIIRVDELIEEMMNLYSRDTQSGLESEKYSVTLVSKTSEDTENVTKSSAKSRISDVNEISLVEKVNEANSSIKPSITPTSMKMKIGQKIHRNLKKGKQVDENIINELILLTIRELAPNVSWIVDGYPLTINQFKYLEKVIVGSTADIDKKKVESKTKKTPDTLDGTKTYNNLFDVIINLEISDEICFDRVAEYNEDKTLNSETISDKLHKRNILDKNQVQQRLNYFENSWPKLEQYIVKNNRSKLITISSEKHINNVYVDCIKILEAIMESQKESVIEEMDTEIEDQNIEVLNDSTDNTEKNENTDIAESQQAEPVKIDAYKKGKDKIKSLQKNSAKNSLKKSRSPSAKKKKGKNLTPETTQEEIIFIPKGPAPGDLDWSFVDKSQMEVKYADLLLNHINDTMNNYANSMKTNLQCLREENYCIINYIFNIRNMFIQNLNKEDAQQDLLAEWQRNELRNCLTQPCLNALSLMSIENDISFDNIISDFSQKKEFNDLPEYIAFDIEGKSELHCRLEELQDKLWTLSDSSKLFMEKEKNEIKDNTWLYDRIGFVTNIFLQILQIELSKSEDVCKILTDYYRNVANLDKTDLENCIEFGRIPLIAIDMVNVESSAKLDRLVSESLESQSPGSVNASLTRSAGSISSKKESKEEKKLNNSFDSHISNLIPLIPRNQNISIDSGTKTANKDASKPNNKNDSNSSYECDEERLVHEASSLAISSLEKLIFNAMIQINKQKDIEFEKEKERNLEKEKKAINANAKNTQNPGNPKSKKNRSPSPKKSSNAVIVDNAEEELKQLEESDKKFQQLMMYNEKNRNEYVFALHEQLNSFKQLCEVVKIVSKNMIKDLKNKMNNLCSDMEDWISNRYLLQMKTIDNVIHLFKLHIEIPKKIDNFVILKQDNFLIDTLSEKNVEYNKLKNNVKCDKDIEESLKNQIYQYDTKIKEIQSQLLSNVSIYCIRRKYDYGTFDCSKSFKKVIKIQQQNINVDNHSMNLMDASQLSNLYKNLSEYSTDGYFPIKSFIKNLKELCHDSLATNIFPLIWLEIEPEKIDAMIYQLAMGRSHINWRTFFISLINPFPYPTQKDLLNALNIFKVIDQRNLGYISRQQYEHVELWFTNNNVDVAMTQSSDASFNEYSDYLMNNNRINNIKPLLFDIFANQYYQYQRLYYTDMLLYFASSPNTQQGFLRALAVVSGNEAPYKSFKIPTKNITDICISETSQNDKSKNLYDFVIEEEIDPDAGYNKINALQMYHAINHKNIVQTGVETFDEISTINDMLTLKSLNAFVKEFGNSADSIEFSTLYETDYFNNIIQHCNQYQHIDLNQYLQTDSPSTRPD